MKKLFTTFMVCACAYYADSQLLGNSGGLLGVFPQWKTSGNILDETQFFGSTNAQPLVFKTNGIERFRITSDGKMGIGTSTPISTFNVVGQSTLNGSLSLPALSDISNEEFDFLVVNVNGEAKTGGFEELAKKIKTSIYAPPYPNEPSIPCDLPGMFPAWYNGPNKLFTRCPQVNVGIRTAEPRVALDVIGTTFTQTLAVGIAPDDMVGRVHVKHFSPNLDSKILIIENNTRKLLTLDNSGLLRAREIKVDAQAWPDYVFKPNYELMPLSEVETFIQKEGHLPAFPSAQEIEENGMNVYETNKLLVEKIEELTLHLITQEKQLKEQNQRIVELEK